MDYNIKKENRKKFQDKSKLKRHHKKDYSKVVPKEQNQQNPESNIDQIESEYEDVSDPELDKQGQFVLREGEEEYVNEEGVKAVKRKKIDKTKSNAWRYKDDVDIIGLDEDEEELIKSIDFKKLDFNKIDSRNQNEVKDYKKMSRDELLNLKIVDERYDKAKDDDELDELLNLSNSPPRTHTIRKSQAPVPPSNNKTPSTLKSDEAFLDDLI